MLGIATSPEPDSNRFEDGEEFFRRIPHWEYDFQNGSIHDRAFKNDRLDTGEDSGRLSVNWRRLITLEETLEGHVGFGIAVITARACYDEVQTIEETPRSNNPAHCDIVGSKPKPRQRRLRKAATLIRPPSKPLSPQ